MNPKTLEEYKRAFNRSHATDTIRRRLLSILIHGNLKEKYKTYKFYRKYGDFDFMHTHEVNNVSEPLHQLYCELFNRKLKDKKWETGVKIE